MKLFKKRRPKKPSGSHVARGSIYDYGSPHGRGRRIVRSEHPPLPWLRRAGSTEGRTFTEKLQNLGVSVFNRAAQQEELRSYLAPSQPAAAEPPPPVDWNFGFQPHDRDAELRGYLGGDEAA